MSDDHALAARMRAAPPSLGATVPPSPFEAALEAERIRNGRRLTWIRFAAVTLFLVVTIVFVFIEEGANDLPVFAAYWVFAAALFVLSRRHAGVARYAGIAVPIVDMPVIFHLQLALYAFAHPSGVAGFTIGFFVLLIAAVALSLEPWLIVLAAIVATVLELRMQWLAGISAGAMTASVLMLGFAALTGLFSSRRTVRLVQNVAREQLRRERLGRYFSPQIAARVQERGDEAGSERREVTILFCDIRSFTAFSEHLGSEEVVAVLNDFHTRMVATIFGLGGTLDKFLGDGLMAYFGAPVDQADHAERGVACALEMVGEMARFNRDRAARGEAPLEIGIGLHTGTVVVGDIGAPQRREYTAIGDAVNVASHVEQLTKRHRTPILVSDETRRRAAGRFQFAAAGAAQVKGRSQPVDCFVPSLTRDGRMTTTTASL